MTTTYDRDRFNAPKLAMPTDREVHIWYASLVQPYGCYQRLSRILSEDEQERASHFYFEHDRRRFVIGRGVLRDILGKYTGIRADECQFSYGKHGKPELALIHESDLRFNLSHSGELAIYAITRNWEVGIDLELVRPLVDADQIARRFFSERENAALTPLLGEQRLETFFSYWTCKEAIVKVMGAGLSCPLQWIDTETVPPNAPGLISVQNSEQILSRWLLQRLNPPQGYVASLALAEQQTATPRIINKRWTA